MDILKIAQFVENKLTEDGYTSKDVGKAWYQMRYNHVSLKDAYPKFYAAIEKYTKEYYKLFYPGTEPEYIPDVVFGEITL